MSHITRHTSNVKRHTSSVTHHTSHVTRQASHLHKHVLDPVTHEINSSGVARKLLNKR